MSRKVDLERAEDARLARNEKARAYLSELQLVWECAYEQLTTEAIAQRLGIDCRTVRRHLRTLRIQNRRGKRRSRW